MKKEKSERPTPRGFFIQAMDIALEAPLHRVGLAVFSILLMALAWHKGWLL